jgi:hypothetical protein
MSSEADASLDVLRAQLAEAQAQLQTTVQVGFFMARALHGA